MAACSPRRARAIEGSCLLELPKLAGDQFRFSLNVAALLQSLRLHPHLRIGIGFMRSRAKMIFDELRQTLLSATVENKSKRETLKGFYTNLGASSPLLI